MAVEESWLRLNAGWSDSQWLADLPWHVRAVWTEFLCFVKSTGKRGRCKAVPIKRFAGAKDIPTEAAGAFIDAAIAAGAVALEDGHWVVTEWSTYQEGDGSSAERMRRKRERDAELAKLSQDENVTQDVTDVTSRDGVTLSRGPQTPYPSKVESKQETTRGSDLEGVDSPAKGCLQQLQVLACVQNCKNQDDAGQVLLLENLISRVKIDFPPGEEWPYWAGWVASRASSKPAYTSATASQTAAAVLERFLPDIQAEIARRKANQEALGDQFGKQKEPERKLGRDFKIDPVTGQEVPIMAGAV